VKWKMIEAKKKMGRPKLPKYRSKLHRYGKIEDKFAEVYPLMKSTHDRKLIERVLEELKK
jgi:hypothetical protein